MFEELNNDLKLVKEYFAETTFDMVADAAYLSDDALDSLKGMDGVACVKEGGPSGSKYNNVLCGDDLKGLAPKSADCLIVRDALCRVSDPASYIACCRGAVKDGGFFVICDTVADIEDSYLNAAEFRRDNGHVRFYTVKEVAGWTEGLFSLGYYKRAEKVMSLETWKGGSAVSLQELVSILEKFPESVRKELNFVRGGSGDLLGFTMKRGVFIFRALPEI